MRHTRIVGSALVAASVATLSTFAVTAPAQATPSGGAVPPELLEVVSVTGIAGVPPDAAMVALNVTAVGPAAPGFLTVFACDEDQPTTSNVNYLTDQIAPNLVLSRVADDGTVCVATHAVTDVLVDLVGFVPAGSEVTPLATPVRVVDTRDPASGSPSPRPARSVLEIPVAGLHGVAPDADVVMFNATAIGHDTPGYLTAYPCGVQQPVASSVNYLPHQIVPNMVTSRVGDNGSICVFTLAPADIVVDVAAYATEGITPLTQPIRLVDTREGGRLEADGTLTLDVAARADVPDDATAASYNVTAVDPGASGFVTAYPCDSARPGVSNLNYRTGQIVANGAITKLSVDGQLCLYSLAPTDLIVDLVAYTQGAGQYQPVVPTRLVDTREGWQSQCDWVLQGTIDGRRLNAFNVASGQTTTIELPPGQRSGAFQTMWPVVTRDCTGVWLSWIWAAAPGSQGLWRLGFDGSRQKLPLPFEFNDSSGQLRELGDGRVVAITGSAVVSLLGGPVSLMVPPSIIEHGGRTYRRKSFTVVGDADLTAAVYDDGASYDEGLLVVFEPDGAELARTEVPREVERVTAPRSGPYLAVDTRGGSQVGDDFTGFTAVYTVFGDLVDVIGTPTVWISSRFTGAGSLITCAGDLGVYRWQLFGPVEQLIPIGHPFFADAGTHCTQFGA